jgi:hypothetical protein
MVGYLTHPHAASSELTTNATRFEAFCPCRSPVTPRDNNDVVTTLRGDRSPSLPVYVELAEEPDTHPGGSSAHIRLRRQRDSQAPKRSWEAVITLEQWAPLRPERSLAHAHGFHVVDPEGDVGIVVEVDPAQTEADGTLSVSCGWFGRRLLEVAFDDVEEILPAEQRLILRSGLPAVKAERCASSKDATRITTKIRAFLRRRDRNE